MNDSFGALFRLSLGKREGRVRVRIANPASGKTPHLNPLPFTKDTCLALSSFPACHSERSEEISDHFFYGTPRQKPEVFRFAQHDR